jgi:hypothetical protein
MAVSAQPFEIQIWPIDRLALYVRNPRKNDAVVDRMCSSIREFGFKIPVSSPFSSKTKMLPLAHGVRILSPAGRPRGELQWEGVNIPTAFTYDPIQRLFLVANQSSWPCRPSMKRA